jgi:uncharacterized protein (TIGR02757 family)
MGNTMMKKRLNRLYSKYNQRKYVHPDPLGFLYQYTNIKDREIVALVASSLAYGRVAQILKSVSEVLSVLNPSPYKYLKTTPYGHMCRSFDGFKHRFSDGMQLAALLWQIKKVILDFGSLNQCFIAGMSENDENVLPGMIFLSQRLTSGNQKPCHLIAMPEKRSACKRMNLFLRWVVRKDRVDPGGWRGISPAKLIIPLDTHMHKIGLMLGFTQRKQATLSAAMDITSGFRKFVPDDPVKYDFALTRFGIREEMNVTQMLDYLKGAEAIGL